MKTGMTKTLLPLMLIMKLDPTLSHSTVLKTVVTETSIPNTESTLTHSISTIVLTKNSVLSLNQDISQLVICLMAKLVKTLLIISKILSTMPTTKKMDSVLLKNQPSQPDTETCVQLQLLKTSFGNGISTSMTTKPEVTHLLLESISVKDTDIGSTETSSKLQLMTGGGITIGTMKMFFT